MSDYKIATEAEGTAGLTALTALTTPVPAPTAFYREYQKQVETAGMRIIGQGYPGADWVFPRLTLAQRAQLRTYCPGQSAVVYIRTVDNAGAYANYKAVMQWPQEEKVRGGMVFELTILMKRLEVQA